MLTTSSRVANKPEGYRYVRSYWAKSGEYRVALWEKRDGRARRVGTAKTDEEYRAFLGLGEEHARYWPGNRRASCRIG